MITASMPIPASTLGQLAIAVPTYKERDNIRRLVRELISLIPEVQILIVDDNSPDGTADIIKELRKSNPCVRLLSRPRKSGLASAYFDLFRQIIADENIEYVVTMDADHSHDPKDLP